MLVNVLIVMKTNHLTRRFGGTVHHSGERMARAGGWGSTGWQEFEAAGHVASAVRKQTEMDAVDWLAFSISFRPGLL